MTAQRDLSRQFAVPVITAIPPPPSFSAPQSLQPSAVMTGGAGIQSSNGTRHDWCSSAHNPEDGAML